MREEQQSYLTKNMIKKAQWLFSPLPYYFLKDEIYRNGMKFLLFFFVQSLHQKCSLHISYIS